MVSAVLSSSGGFAVTQVCGGLGVFWLLQLIHKFVVGVLAGPGMKGVLGISDNSAISSVCRGGEDVFKVIWVF